LARIRQDDIDAVKERTDIVQLVGNYLSLKKTGHDSLSGLCPFHQEKTASFSVSPSKQVFYCFGCGKGGDAITFLRELEHLGLLLGRRGALPLPLAVVGILAQYGVLPEPFGRLGHVGRWAIHSVAGLPDECLVACLVERRASGREGREHEQYE